MTGERELEKYIGRGVARWRGRLLRTRHAERSNAIWLTAFDGDDELGELANGAWGGKPARLVSLDELTELYDVSAKCRLEGNGLEVMGIDGDTVHVSYFCRGENAFTRKYGLAPIDWDVSVGDVDRSQLDSLEVTRRDFLEESRAYARLKAVLGEDTSDLGRSWCRHPADAKPWLTFEAVPEPGSEGFRVPKRGAAGEPKTWVPVEELESWTVRVAYARYDGHDVCLDSVHSAYQAKISTTDAAWAEADGMGFPYKGWHPVHWLKPHWTKDVPLTELTDFRAESIDVLARLAAG